MRTSIIGLSLVLAVATAHADDKAKAKKLYDTGLSHYNVAEYTEAIRAWKEAYLLSKKPMLLFNVGQAYRLSGDCKQAMTFYDSYQREEPNPKNQDELDQALALCKDKPDDKPKTVDKPKVDDKPKSVDKPKLVDKPVADTPKPIVAQQETEASEPDEPVDEPTTTGGGLRKAGIGVAIGGVLLGGLGIYFALDSGKTADTLDGYQGEWGQDQIDLEARGKRSAMLGWVTGGLGIAAIAAGGVMFAIGGPQATETSSVSITPTRGGMQLGWSTEF